jgi:DNA-directed RNA polymerase specialized sigma24 family protein
VERAGTAGDDPRDANVLVAQAKAGDEGAWRALVGRHLGLVHAICRGHGLADDAAAAVNQLVWLQLVEHLPRIRTPDALGGWIAAVTRSLCLAPERSAERSGYVTAAVGGAAGGATGGATGPVADGSRLAAAFARIGARCQRLLRLAATSPRPADEDVSAALDLPIAAVEPACIGCLDRLRRLAAAEADLPAVLAELGRTIAAADPVPSGWWDAARPAYAWLTLDVAPAERVYDSTTTLCSGTASGAWAGDQAVRRIRFSGADEGVELLVDTKGDEVLLTGRLASGRSAAVTARWPGGERTASADDNGGFRFHGLPTAPVSIEVGGDHPLKTGWILP